IEVRGSACEKIKENVEKNASRPVPMWMSFDKDALKVVVNRLPERSEIELDVEEQLIVELYSK
ncbi:MAG: 30S ribosomal protein S4, partial [Oscillospiraceae bacterium]|nr:30S ribosomal protein S4 [Oscillospiraceae bacterium]